MIKKSGKGDVIMKAKYSFFVMTITLLCLNNLAYAKGGENSGGHGGVSQCELLSNKYEDLDCVDASTTGPICEPEEEIISLPRGKSQLCCCTRNSDLEDLGDGGSSVDGEDTSTSDGEDFPGSEPEPLESDT